MLSSESLVTGKILTYVARLQGHRPTHQKGSRQGQHRESFDETSTYTFQLRYVDEVFPRRVGSDTVHLASSYVACSEQVADPQLAPAAGDRMAGENAVVRG
jgi:hypothetical protein